MPEPAGYHAHPATKYLVKHRGPYTVNPSHQQQQQQIQHGQHPTVSFLESQIQELQFKINSILQNQNTTHLQEQITDLQKAINQEQENMEEEEDDQDE